MKRILAVIFLLSVVACGGGAGGGTPGPAGANGADGAAGPQGDPGIAPIPAGTVSSTDKIAVVSGTLTPDSGVPASEISGATVYAVGQQGSGATTDASGGYTLTVDLNSASQIAVVQKPLLQRIAGWLKGGPKAATAFTQVGLVSISPTNAHGKKINLSLQEGTAVNLPNITITTVGKISGNVKLQNGTDHTGIMVYIPGTSFLALTDAAGNFTITNVPEGDYSYLRASISGYKHSMLSTITVASNATTTVVDQLLLIDTGATGSLLINTGAAVSANKMVNVNVAASSTAILMLYSESSIFLNAAWEPLQSSFTYTFDTEGAKTLYIKFADANGLESPVYSDSITVNGNWQTPLTAPSSAARTNDTTPTFTWTADALAATYNLVISKNADLSTPDLTVTAIAAATYTLTAAQALPASAGQLYYWSVRPVDAIGVAGAYATASNFTLDTTAPTVSSKTPAANAASVATTSLVSAVFGEALDANSLAAGTFTVATTTGSVQKTGAISYNSSTNTATFTPTGGLAGTTQYTANLTTAIKDVAGNALAALYSWNFTTAAGWVHPSGVSDRLSSTGLWSMKYDMAMNENGDIAVVFLDQGDGVACNGPCDRVFLATFNRTTRTWTKPATKTSADYFGVGNQHAANPHVAMNTAGNIVITWEQSNAAAYADTSYNMAYMAECRAGNCTDPAVNIPANWTEPAGVANSISLVGDGTNRVAVGSSTLAMDNASGKTVIAWAQQDTAMALYRIYRSFYNGGWTHPANLAAVLDPTGYSQIPVAAFKGGKGLITWIGWNVTNVLYASMYDGTNWMDPVLANNLTTAVALQYATGYTAAMSANGTGVITWNQSDGANPATAHIYAIKWKGVNAYDATGWNLALPVNINSFISPAGNVGGSPKVAMDSTGNALVAWLQKDDTILCSYQGCNSVFKSTFNGTAWTNPSGLSDNISLNGQNVGDPYVAMDAAGNALIVYTMYDGSRTWIYKSELRGGTWTNPLTVSEGFGVTIPGTYSGYTSPSTPLLPAMGNSGEAVVIWQQGDGTTNCSASMSCNQIFKSEYR